MDLPHQPEAPAALPNDDFSQYFKKVADDLNDIKALDPAEMFRYLMNFGKMLMPLSPAEMTEENFVHGCVSNAYVLVEPHDLKPGFVQVRGHSDAMVVRGFMAIVAHAFSLVELPRLCAEAEGAIGGFLKSVELDIILTPTRANAFGNIVALMLTKAARLRDAKNDAAQQPQS